MPGLGAWSTIEQTPLKPPATIPASTTQTDHKRHTKQQHLELYERGIKPEDSSSADTASALDANAEDQRQDAASATDSSGEATCTKAAWPQRTPQ